MFTALNLIITLGAILRLTRLINSDTITRPLRDKVPTCLRTFVVCPWCVGFWVALIVVAVSWAAHDHGWYQYGALVLTISWIVGIFAQWLDAPPPDRILRLLHSGHISGPGGPSN